MKIDSEAYDLSHPFKVVSARSGAKIASFLTRASALAFADAMCRETHRQEHFRVYEVVWVGGSEKLEDHVPKASGL